MVADKNSVTKEQHERHKKILDALLKLPENRCCADCGSRGPRWASVNLGVFLCIQCSGIHRSLGVHISQVRSATLDTWLPDQVAFIQKMGNQKANEYWEADLPGNFKRPNEQDRPAVESFIRAKYERKAFVARERRRSKEDRPASRHEGGYSSDHGPASRPANDDHKGNAAPSRYAPAAGPTLAVKVPAPRAPAQPAPPRVATSSAPPHKVESAPALFDLLSLNDPAPAKAPTSPTAAPPAATATAAPAQSPGGWAAFPEPSQPATTAAPATASAAATPAPAPAPASTMSALTDLFTASTPTAAASHQAPSAAAATPEKPRKNANDILSLFDQGSPFMNPQQAQLQQQMLYMQQQQQFGGMPGIHPGGMPGVHLGSMPGVHPGSMPAVHPGAMPGMYPQPVPQGSPEPSANHLPVSAPHGIPLPLPLSPVHTAPGSPPFAPMQDGTFSPPSPLVQNGTFSPPQFSPPQSPPHSPPHSPPQSKGPTNPFAAPVALPTGFQPGLFGQGGPFVPQMMPGYAPYGQGMPPAGFPGFYANGPQPGFQAPYNPAAPVGGPLGGLGGPEQYQPQAPVAAASGPGNKDAPGAQYDFSDLQAFAK